MYGETFYGHHTAQHQLQWRQMKIKTTKKKKKKKKKKTVPFKAMKAFIRSKKISNDQELIQLDPTSCPQNQKGNN